MLERFGRWALKIVKVVKKQEWSSNVTRKASEVSVSFISWRWDLGHD